LKAQQKNGVIQGPIQILGGQPGVFYHFSTAEGAVLGPPVYFHQTDDADPSQNKGVGQLALEVDFVVTPPLPPARLQPSPDPAKTRPEPPILDIGTSSLQTSTQLSIRAVKAQTGLEVTFKPGTVGDLLARPDPS